MADPTQAVRGLTGVPSWHTKMLGTRFHRSQWQLCRPTPNQPFMKSARVRDHRGVDLISDVLPFGRLWYTKPDDAIGYAMHYSRSRDAVIHVYNAAGKVIETHEHAGGFQRVVRFSLAAHRSSR